MGHVMKSGNSAHDSACQAAESTRQATVAGATKDPAGQIVVNNAEIDHQLAA